MKKSILLILLILLILSILSKHSPAQSPTPSPDLILTAINTAFTAATAHPQKVPAAPIPGATNWTVRTDVYSGPKGSGFQVVAALSISGTSFTISQQSGAETRRQNLPALKVFQRRVLAGLDAQYRASLAKGITVTSGTTTLALAATESDQNAFSRLLNLLNTATMPASITMADIKGVAHTVPVTTVYALLGSYGQQVAALWANYTAAKSNVQAAARFDQL